ncbi:hypothetical protein T12_423 [Trichinella patagoniensis]|uniref:Uncharacterized protein n=1 Tax=Trichinella patagoniensis TaxID=990121 RepID=A0A0V0ZY08_9BILA|nr:hypothetical protein T12_423 [Trichinella patagoniensis]
MKLNTSYTGDENEVELVIIAIAKNKVIHHTNVSITGTIRRNLQRTTISYKHSIAHGEKLQRFVSSYNNNKDETILAVSNNEKKASAWLLA